jgi:hypothetical protein
MKKIFSIILLSFSYTAFSQCCTSGCCTPGTANFGVLEKGDLLVFSFFKRNYSDKYYKGDVPVNYSYLVNDYADFSGVSMSYGITNKLTAQASMGYFISKTENYILPIVGQQQFMGQGFSDAEVYLKYNIFHAKSDVLNLTVSGGAKLPTGPYRLAVDKVELTRDVQPGTGAYSGIGMLFAQIKPFKDKTYAIMINSRFDCNGVNPEGYRYGFGNTNTISTSFKLVKDVSLLIMFRNENKDTDQIKGKSLFSSCYTRVFAAPGITISPGHNMVLAVYGDFPIYQYYAGYQFAAKYAFSIALSKVFEFHEKHTEIPPWPVK